MHGVFASLQHMHKGEDTTQLTSKELVDEFLGDHFAPMVEAVEVPIKEVTSTRPEQAKSAIDKELHANDAQTEEQASAGGRDNTDRPPETSCTTASHGNDLEATISRAARNSN